jgi:hypothetical protein
MSIEHRPISPLRQRMSEDMRLWKRPEHNLPAGDACVHQNMHFPPS